ncbi:MAG: GDP-mannose 4,6-dehydratase [Candidatus Omnitrophota bacterium]
MKKALITGITGQDGSYLAELLLEKGYEVHGMIRRVALEDPEHRLWRLRPIIEKLILHPASLESYASIFNVVERVKPDECYHLAAQSFVSYSFEDEFSTINTNINGTHFVLSAIKQKVPKCKFYFAASSEMFGLVKETPQRETTHFHPRSPYGISKVAGFYLTQNYREAYDMFACNGILFNHESLPKTSPVIIKKDILIDILPIEELFHRGKKHLYEGIKDEYRNQFVWNGKEWTRIINGTVYVDKGRKLNLIQTREACIELTDGHCLFDENNCEVKADEVSIGNRLKKVEFPKEKNRLNDIDVDLAYFIGYIAGDGHIDARGRIRITGTNKRGLLNTAKSILNKYGWTHRLKTWRAGRWSGCKKKVWQLDINNDIEWGLWLRKHIYTSSKEKKVPKFILNNNLKIKSAFFNGYYIADGRKGGHESYQYKGWTTNSAVLNLGLIFLINELTGQKAKTKIAYIKKNRYYYTQLRGLKTKKGKHLLKQLNEVIKINKVCNFKDGTFFDLQTQSQTFASGANLVKIHNSPRRGYEFVSRKITNTIVKIKLGLAKELKLGNLEAKRDWGFAGDYVEAMWLMLQQDNPDDYVIATGETHSVKEFVKLAFNCVGLDWKDYTGIDKTLYRPAEVNELRGDYSKAKKKLGWKPNVDFKTLVKMMVEADLENLKDQKGR